MQRCTEEKLQPIRLSRDRQRHGDDAEFDRSGSHQGLAQVGLQLSSSKTKIFSRTFLRPRNVSHRRKLPRPKGAYGVLAKRQPARGARHREVQHVTQRERVWRTRQRRHGPDSKRGAGDGALQGNRQHTPPAARRRARVVGRVGHGAGVGYGGTAGTRRCSGPRLLQRGLRVVEALRGSTPGSARL